MPADFEYAVVGGGIVGLAVAARLSAAGSTVLLERHRRPLLETSSRNSGVVHAGLYYPPRSLKTALCLSGAATIWRLADRGAVRARRCGKWVVATDDAQLVTLAALERAMSARGVAARWVGPAEARELEPHVVARRVLSSPGTGVVDVGSLGDAFLARIHAAEGSLVAFGAELTAVGRSAAALRLEMADGSSLSASRLVNCAGLHASSVAAMCFGECPEPYRQVFVRGMYAAVPRPGLLGRLVYPCPLPALRGLGVHSVVDLDGQLRFGPDAATSTKADPAALTYELTDADSSTSLDAMHRGIQRFLPCVQRRELRPDFVGFRPKLSADTFRDFVIERGDALGFPEVVTCAGIESPGITASPAIADYVAGLLGVQSSSFRW